MRMKYPHSKASIHASLSAPLQFERSMVKPAVSLCLAAVMLPIGVSAQVAEPPLQELLVTANRFSQFSSDTLNAHTLLDREFISQSAAGSLFDLLRSVPGLQLARTGVDGAQTSLFLRGSNSNHTLILLDGVRLNTASEGVARLEHIPISHIERIEVIRGAQSSVYGADAIGGVIQIFTRSGLAAAGLSSEPEDAVTGRVEAAAGTEQSRTLNGAVRATYQQTTVDINVSQRSTDGIPARNAPVPSTLNSTWENQSVSLGIQQTLNADWQWWGRWQDTDSENIFDGGDSEFSQNIASTGVRGQLSDRWKTQLQVNRFKDNNLTRQWGLSHSTTQRHSLQWQNELRWSNSSNTVLGLDMDDEDLFYLSSGAVQNLSTRKNNALFAVHQQAAGGFDMTASVRLDDNQQFGNHTTGRLAIGRNIAGNSSVWLAASTAFKAPTLVDLYVDFPAFGFFANPGLEPEHARNLEAGLRTSVAGTELDVNVFRNNIRNLIGTDSTFSSLDNVGRARIDGIEIGASRDILGWQSRAAVTLLDHQNRNTGAELLRRPNEQLSVSAARRFDGFSVLLDWQLRSDQADLDPVSFARSRVAGYGVLDTVLEWQVMPALDLQLKVGNVFDNTYEVVDGYATLGRHAMLSARHAF